MPEDLKSMTTEQLEREVGELAAHIAAATCRWLLVVAELDRRRAWADWGSKSCSGWLSYACGLAPSAAREQVRVARRLEELPAVCEAFGKGELSYSKTRAISRVASEESEAELLDLARHATAAQLEKVARAYRGVVSAQVEKAHDTYEDRHFSYQWDDNGSLLVRGRLPAEDGALLMRSLDDARHRLRASAEAPEMEKGPSNADALVSLAETGLATGGAERQGGERNQVVVHVDSAALADDEPGGPCEIENGPALAPETARRLACDASLVTMAERDGRPLSVGRKTRSIPPALRRALQHRDGGCRFPGCTQHRFVDGHHIEHWAHGGETKLSNLLLLCRHHHRLIHEGGYAVQRTGPGSLRFARPNGSPIPAHPRTPTGDRGEIERLPVRAGLEALTGGDRLDYGMAVDLLLEANGLDASAEAPATDGHEEPALREGLASAA